MAMTVESNRKLFLAELRSGKYKKGTIKSDSKGNPVITSESDNDGYCACAVMGHLFGKQPSGHISLTKAASALGLDNKACAFIQKHINDTADDFQAIATKIEKLCFDDDGIGMITQMGVMGEKLSGRQKRIVTKYVDPLKQEATRGGKNIIL